MIDFIILGQIPGTNIFINFYIVLGLMIVAGAWLAHKRHLREKLRKQTRISDKAL